MKCHLHTCEAPLLLSADVTADCGEVIANAVSLYFWDEHLLGEQPLLPMRTCRKCWAVKHAGRYTYVILRGQEAMDVLGTLD